MTRQQNLARLIRDVQADIGDYGVLRGLLDRQFHAALAHHGAELAALAEQITATVEILDKRRAHRIELLRVLTGEPRPRSLDRLLAQLPPAPRELLASCWHELEQLVRDCKAQNVCNCELIVEQNALMRRVLHGEGDTYVES